MNRLHDLRRGGCRERASPILEVAAGEKAGRHVRDAFEAEVAQVFRVA